MANSIGHLARPVTNLALAHGGTASETSAHLCRARNPLRYRCHDATGDEGVRVLCATALASNNSLVHLDLYNNSVTDAGAVLLGTALASSDTTVLATLELHDNMIGDAGAAALAEAAALSALVQIGLRQNVVGDAGAAAFGRVLLEHDVKLTGLALGGTACQVSDVGAAALLKAVAKKANRVAVLLLDGCDVSNSTTDQFKNLAALETSALKQLKMGRARTPALEPPAPAGAPGVRNDQAGDACAYRATATCMQLPHTRARSSCLRSANAPALLGATVAPFPATHGEAGSAGFFLAAAQRRESLQE